MLHHDSPHTAAVEPRVSDKHIHHVSYAFHSTFLVVIGCFCHGQHPAGCAKVHRKGRHRGHSFGLHETVAALHRPRWLRSTAVFSGFARMNRKAFLRMGIKGVERILHSQGAESRPQKEMSMLKVVSSSVHGRTRVVSPEYPKVPKTPYEHNITRIEGCICHDIKRCGARTQCSTSRATAYTDSDCCNVPKQHEPADASPNVRPDVPPNPIDTVP